jgi:hypothetical protein
VGIQESAEAVDLRRSAAHPDVLVRNSTDRSGPVVAFTPREWAAFVADVKYGEFDAPLTG